MAAYIPAQEERLPEFSSAVYIVFGNRGGTVVKVLCYKSEGRWFDFTYGRVQYSVYHYQRYRSGKKRADGA